VPPGSERYWSWLFAAHEARQPLLGIYALAAEWRALLERGTDASVAQPKLLWWRDEIRRLAAGSPLHPITRYLATLPHAESAGLAELELAVDAAAAELAGVPLERAAELGAHADALHGLPLRVVARFGKTRGESPMLRDCTAALAAAQYLAHALHDYRRAARRGRMPFPVDELLEAGIDNDDLAAEVAAPHLRAYLETLRRRAFDYFATAASALSPAERPNLRHLAVLTTLGLTHLREQRDLSSADFHFADLYNAWNAARRWAAGR